MDSILQPIKVTSLKEEVVTYFENMILSGKMKPGQRLPPERELAEKLKVSRPIVHEGLVELQANGLIEIVPRKGNFVKDYRREGTIAILNSLLDYQSTENLDPDIIENILSFRMDFEVIPAGLAAVNRSEDDLNMFEKIINCEKDILHNPIDNEEVALVDFEFHYAVAEASKNIVYPLLINSFKKIYIKILAEFYQFEEVLPEIFRLHRDFVTAVKKQNSEECKVLMQSILKYGAENLRSVISNSKH